MKKWFYEKNEELLGSPVNKTFEEVLWMAEPDFRTWVSDMCAEVIRIWDELGVPPRAGLGAEEISLQFSKMRTYPIHHQVDGFLCTDEETGQRDCIRNNSILGTAARQWFPSMMSTKINHTDDAAAGISIYDCFKESSLLPKMITHGLRYFKRDAFYHYSHAVNLFTSGDDISEHIKKYFLEPKATAVEWIKAYELKRSLYENTFDYWMEANEGGAGFGEATANSTSLKITRDELLALGDLVPDKCKININYGVEDVGVLRIRVFARGQKLFPIGLRAFRTALRQPATNFPPLTAKYLYEKFTENFKDQEQIKIWDPSAGWGGRILGAMCVENDVRRIHYIGTDPNTDHTTTGDRTKYHELADFYNKHTNSPFATNPPHTYEFYQCGSEEMKDQPDFQKYKGKLDIVFTSPPYFAKEIYSDDPGQCSTKFNTFDSWVDGFLRPTLQTASEWLAPDRYLLWNIADAKFSGCILPLEQLSCDILKSLGMVYVGKLKMVLANGPANNRIDPNTGKPKTKNFCRIKETKKGTKERNKNLWFKYTPVFIFKKL